MIKDQTFSPCFIQIKEFGEAYKKLPFRFRNRWWVKDPITINVAHSSDNLGRKDRDECRLFKMNAIVGQRITKGKDSEVAI